MNMNDALKKVLDELIEMPLEELNKLLDNHKCDDPERYAMIEQLILDGALPKEKK